MRARWNGLATLLLVLAAGSACAHGAYEGDGAMPEAVVQVMNNNWSEMTIYAVRNGMRERLGMVTSMTRRTFRLPRHVVMGGGDFRLEADPLGSSRRYQSPSLIIGPGQIVEWRLENNLSLSSAIVRH